MKRKRQAKVLEIIQNTDVETQEELTRRLFECGYKVTQATVSRDIKELRIVKQLKGDGRYKYSPPLGDAYAADSASKYFGILREGIVGIDYAGNLVVVKCHTGMANAACAAIDALPLSDIVGTISGDDTFLIVARNEEKASAILQEITSFLE